MTPPAFRWTGFASVAEGCLLRSVLRRRTEVATARGTARFARSRASGVALCSSALTALVAMSPHHATHLSPPRRCGYATLRRAQARAPTSLSSYHLSQIGFRSCLFGRTYAEADCSPRGKPRVCRGYRHAPPSAPRRCRNDLMITLNASSRLAGRRRGKNEHILRNKLRRLRILLG